jgi:hypothetical protein
MAAIDLFLNPNNSSWSEAFDHAIEVLQNSWSYQWLGLPQVLEASIDFLNIQNGELTSETRQLLFASHDIACKLEDLCHNTSSYVEPLYHNRLHTAHVLVSMTLMIAIESERQNVRSPKWWAAALLTALAHDFAHPGRVNSKPSELEQQAVMDVLPILRKHEVKSEWVSCIQHAILRSDFAMVNENHDRIKGQSFEWNRDWLAVLLNEADILGSSVSLYGVSLGLALSDEWRLIDYSPYSTVATPSGRQNFLKSLKFSTNASRILGVQERISKQLSD